MERKVSLTIEQAELCQTVLSQYLKRVLFLACKKDTVGPDLKAKTERELMGLQSRLAKTLDAFGMTSEQLDGIIRGSGTDL